MTSHLSRVLVWAALFSAVPSPSASAQQLPISFGTGEVVGAGAGIVSIMAATVAPDGGVYVIDHPNSRVVAFDPEGRQRWSLGRRGRGPGEFQTPYRVDVRRDGTVFVFDMGTGELTTISAEGRFLERYRLPFALRQVNSLVALDDVLLIAGTAREGAGSGHAIHRFRIEGRELRYAGSFGPLPVVRDPEVLAMWGAGSIVRGSTGSIWYTRSYPYEVYRFDATGRRRALVRPPFRTRGTPDDAIRIERGERGRTISSTQAEVDQPGPAWELPGGLLLVTRYRAGVHFWDLFSIAGRFHGSHRLPDHWDGIAGYDASRGVLWLTGTRGADAVLHRVPVVLSTRSNRRP